MGETSKIIDEMITFDIDMCDSVECKKKNTCKRYLTYLKAEKEDHFPIYLINTDGEISDDCKFYIKK